MKNLLKRVFMLGIMTALLLSKGVVSFAMETDATNISSETSENTVIENEVIIEVNSNFTGEITSEMRELGVISLEKIFDIGDTIMYLVRIENAPDDVIEKLQEMSDINSAEYNQMVFTTEAEMNIDSSSNNTTAAATSNKGIFLPLLIVISIAIFCSILGCVFLNSAA